MHHLSILEYKFLKLSHLVKGILDGEDRVVLDESLVHLSQLIAGDPILGLAFGVLEVQVVLAVLAELARRNVHSNKDLAWGQIVFSVSIEYTTSLFQSKLDGFLLYLHTQKP